VRVQDINAKKRLLAHENDPHLKEYGIKVSPSMTRVNARRLASPQLAFGKGAIVKVEPGLWDPRNAVFKQVCPLILSHH
jgi:eukaryotic translation initiation factor 2C